MVAVILIWAGNNALSKWALGDIDPVAFVLSRFALVVALLFPWLLVRGANLRVRRADWLPLLLSGLLGFAVYNLLFTIGLAHTSSFSVGLLVSLGPVFTLLFAAALRIERVRAGQWLGVAVALAGIAIFVGEKLARDAPARGDLLGVLAAVCFAIYGLLARRLSGRYPAPVITGWSALIGLVATLPLATGPALAQDWVGIGWRGWGAMLYSSALSMLLAYSLYSWAIARRGVGRTVPYMYLVPVLTGVLSLIFFDEVFGPIKLLGAMLALGGLVLVRGVSAEARLPRRRHRRLQLEATSQPAESNATAESLAAEAGLTLRKRLEAG
jgi:drug/metabolite transporter (DMT)-like permease